MQTRCGTGTKNLTKREKSALYYEIELSKPWRSFCDRCVGVELENILKEILGGGEAWLWFEPSFERSRKRVQGLQNRPFSEPVCR